MDRQSERQLDIQRYKCKNRQIAREIDRYINVGISRQPVRQTNRDIYIEGDRCRYRQIDCQVDVESELNFTSSITDRSQILHIKEFHRIRLFQNFEFKIIINFLVSSFL